jgi:putative transcriptional regulator
MKKEVFLKKLGERVVKLRLQNQLSQADLARACDKDPQSIDRLEHGNINPSVYYLNQIAEGLGMSLKDLLDF